MGPKPSFLGRMGYIYIYVCVCVLISKTKKKSNSILNLSFSQFHLLLYNIYRYID